MKLQRRYNISLNLIQCTPCRYARNITILRTCRKIICIVDKYIKFCHIHFHPACFQMLFNIS